MNTKTNIQADYRYPGSRPFYDNDIDRRLFFGRDTEKDALLHKVLVENLVVLYARSGMGKTSLLNAGLNQALRDRGFIPLMVRFNNPGLDPVQGIYAGIEEIAKQVSIEVEPGEDATLWQYFKTTYFWSGSNKMLTPVLILDQFEEFFTLYSPGERKGFIRQLADVVNNKIPASLLESIQPGEAPAYSDDPPNVKIIFSIREDYIGQLDEMSREIPDILHHRFRLLPLSREQARQAIIKPSQVQDEAISAASFTFAAEAVDMMLDFLCKRRERDTIKMTDEVESFQLQLLCRHIEDMALVRMKKVDVDIIVKKEDLGGEAGMQRVLQRFYDDQVKKMDTPWKRRKARKLCEKGLISVAGLRLSLEEGEIKRKFRISKKQLLELVNSRLLRAEPRVGSVYYELSHDTLVIPIRESQRKRKSKRRKIGFGILSIILIILIIVVFFIGKIKNGFVPKDQMIAGDEYFYRRNFEKAIEHYKKAIKINPKYAPAYNVIGYIQNEQEKYEEAIEYLKKAIEIDSEFAGPYNNIGYALYKQKKYEEAIKYLKKAIEIDPKHAYAYNNMGNAYYYGLKKNNEATNCYKKAIEIDPKCVYAYKGMGDVYYNQKEYNKAIDYYKKAIEIDPKYAYAYNNMGNAYYYGLKKNNEATNCYKKAIEFDPKCVYAYKGMGDVYYNQKEYNKAIDYYKKAIEIDPENAYVHNMIGNAYYYLKKYEEAIAEYKETIKIDSKYADAYNNMGNVYYRQKEYNKAIDYYKKTIEIDPKYADAYNNMGNVYYRQKEYNKAIDYYKKTIEIDPKYADAYNSMGNVYYRRKEYNKAIDYYKKTIEIDPENAYVHNRIGNAYLFQNEYKTAIDFYKKTIEIDPKYAHAYNSMGNAYYYQREYNKAIDFYKQTIEIDPGYTWAKRNLAETYMITGHFNDALALANELLKEKDISTHHILAMRFVSICSLVFLEKQLEAADQLKKLIKYYKTIPGEYERHWRYSDIIEDFITNRKKLTQKQRELLLQLVDLLESPKKQGDKKLKELEISIKETFK
jgi:tetratricopeptide (TPR) repeat protein